MDGVAWLAMRLRRDGRLNRKKKNMNHDGHDGRAMTNGE